MKKSKDFEIFKNECLRLQKEWHLNGWSIRFEHKDYRDSSALAFVDGANHTCTMALSYSHDYGTFKEQLTKKDFIKGLAKHEMIHMLLGRLTWCGESRYGTKEEMTSAEEELVRKLMDII